MRMELVISVVQFGVVCSMCIHINEKTTLLLYFSFKASP